MFRKLFRMAPGRQDCLDRDRIAVALDAQGRGFAGHMRQQGDSEIIHRGNGLPIDHAQAIARL